MRVFEKTGQVEVLSVIAFVEDPQQATETSRKFFPVTDNTEVMEAALTGHEMIFINDDELSKRPDIDKDHPEGRRRIITSIFQERFPAPHSTFDRVSVDYRSYEVTVTSEDALLMTSWGLSDKDIESLLPMVKEKGVLYCYHSIEQSERMLERGLYVRPAGPNAPSNASAEIVYDEEVAARRLKKKLERLANPKPPSGYLRLEEFWRMRQVMSSKLDLVMETGCFSIDYYHRRTEMVRALERLFTLYNLVFGRNSHRQLKEFQEFLELWRKRGERTKLVFDYSGVALFRWFDEEAKIAKPRSRKLKPTKRLIDCPISLLEDDGSSPNDKFKPLFNAEGRVAMLHDIDGNVDKVQMEYCRRGCLQYKRYFDDGTLSVYATAIRFERIEKVVALRWDGDPAYEIYSRTGEEEETDAEDN